jgi:threonine/homoserine/homoserine lactone efflux protein
VALFFLVVLPRFADPTDGGAVLQLLVLGLDFALFTGVIFSVLGYLSGRLGNWLLGTEVL